MTQVFLKLSKQYANIFGVLIVGLAVSASTLLYSGCGSTSSPNVPRATPTPTPTPTPDTAPPTSAITSPANGASIVIGTQTTITGTASDTGGGTVAKVDVSVNGGAAFAAATGTTSWTFAFTPSALGAVTIQSRATDSAGNVQNPITSITVTIVSPPDTTPPTVTTFSPAPGASNVSVDTNVVVTFSEAMDATTVNLDTVQIQDPTNAPVPATVTYDAATFTATLDPTAPLAANTTYKVQVKGGNTGPRVKDVAGNALASNATSTFTTIKPPAPQVVSTTPGDGASGVIANIAPTAKFANPLNPSTVNATTVLLNEMDMSNTPVTVTVSYEPVSSTIALVPTAPLKAAQMYQVTLKGGASGIADPFGQLLAADATFGFATGVAAQVTTVNVFTNQVPANIDVADGSTIYELGMKFRANQNGLVTGVRFYKGTATSDIPRVGHLWDPDQPAAPLASVTFTSETPDAGWQTALFPTPITITANKTYIVSYLTRIFSSTENFFAGPAGIDNDPLHALGNEDTASPGNGVALQDAPIPNGGFPNVTFAPTNYFVDVVFSPELQVLSVNPAPGAAGVPVDGALTARFSEALTGTTVNSTTVMLRNAANVLIPADVTYDDVTFTITITPAQALQPGQAYTVILKGGPGAITDAMGTPLAGDYIWSFTTAPATP